MRSFDACRIGAFGLAERVQSSEAKVGSPRNKQLKEKKTFGKYELSEDQQQVSYVQTTAHHARQRMG
jgi:hypothetical protein